MALDDLYRQKLRDGELAPDSAQQAVLEKLSLLAAQLNAAAPSGSVVAKWLKRKKKQLRGLYLHGEVGRGKTMLMDLFFASIEGWPKRRVHFHAFMQEVHALRTAHGGDRVIARIADAIADSARLLCLDEMQIADIADAMIIGRLYEALLERGVVLVTTSNLPPDELYRDGLNRQLFLPFIARIKETMTVVSLASPRDYRLGRLRARETFLHPITEKNRAVFAGIWRDLTDGAHGEPASLDILGRQLAVPRAAHGCARFTFADLCENPLGPPDYLAIAKAFRTVFIEGIPKLKPHQRNEAKRFILMIDTFYDAGLLVVALAEVAPENLFAASQHSRESARTVSRLKEMQSSAWWGTAPAET